MVYGKLSEQVNAAGEVRRNAVTTGLLGKEVDRAD